MFFRFLHQVRAISLDSHDEFLASCAADGRVVVRGLMGSEHDEQIQLEKPILSVAIAPDFYRLRDCKQLITADDRLILVKFKKGNIS